MLFVLEGLLSLDRFLIILKVSATTSFFANVIRVSD